MRTLQLQRQRQPQCVKQPGAGPDRKVATLGVAIKIVRQADQNPNTQQRNQSLLSRNFDMLVAPGGLHILHMDGFLAPHHRAQKTFPDTQARLLNVVFAGAKTRAQIQPRPRLIHHHQRAHFRLHQPTRFPGDGVQRLVQVEG